MQARGSTHVAASAAEAFAFIADGANDTRWRSYVLSSHGHARAVGDRLHQTYSYQGRTVELELVVTELAPPERLSLKTEGPVRGRIAFQCRPDDDGTRVSMSLSAALPAAAALFEGRIQSEAEAIIKKDLARLKRALESGE